ncbi:autotransporter assembly complex protein TamA [Acidocella aminolytica]|jgi:translocation and assembly module TamA|uniref:Outer membrane protein n=1 Tax=Acidocella aminolytica 101 = DSM 11237 TaxID=1120923 RepID=A0A0D6PL59_9PROT|nr:BamA/TamA family outer membrane protein [Acidocella aminolytica]GAN81504.1 outer membrane protein [Acidocella aminolytica 101 = DSM 11237]GBQ34004.1 outer membrane protein [Acidocella aminolytica 101 = DSM 11237]SHF02689.1 autotransporter secretion outer membrane protein TamA [Acidocella aminolytica 101 = DSM 11237]
MRRWTKPLLCLCLTLGGNAAQGADPVHYNVMFAPSGNTQLDGLLKQTSTLVSLQTKLPPAPFALIGRARADEKQFITVLHSLGYDAGQTHITIDGMTLDDPALLAHLNKLPDAGQAKIEVKTDKGPLFTLGKVDITGLPTGFKARPGIHAGQTADAAPVLAAQGRLTKDLRNAGYAFAKVSPPYAVANQNQHTLNVSYSVTPGPRVDIGQVSFSGLKRTKPDFLRRHIRLHAGQPYSDTALQNARTSLLGLGVFSSVTPVPAEKATDGQVPITFHVAEMKRHTVSLSGAYATDTGFSIGTSWKDRNVFGRAETFTLSATANGLGGTGTTAPGYDLKGVFTKPDYYVRRQTLTLSVEGLKESLTAYNRTGILLGASLSRPITANTSISYGPSFINERVYQEGVTRTYVLAQFPINFTWDTSNSVLEPTRGHTLTFTATPTYPVVGNTHSPFVILLGTGSVYWPVERKAWGVVAMHGVVGSIQGTSQFGVPPDQRFYAGGSGTVRGYSYQTIGPLFPDDKPEGGLAMDAINFEFRQHITKSIGIVPFIDAGQVSAGSAPFKGTVRVGMGLGARYYTSIGPIRADIAFPMKRTAGSSAFALYIGLGEAF